MSASEACAHELVRYPVVERGVDYWCARCGEFQQFFPPNEIAWVEIDQWAADVLGGRVVGTLEDWLKTREVRDG